MTQWVQWCLDHRLAYVVYAAIVLSLPLFLIVGAACGAWESIGDWLSDFKSVRKAAQRAQARKEK